MVYKVAFVSVVPSPYQRDLFRALAKSASVDLSVHYLEAAAPDSPWPEKPLAEYERILPGFWFPFGSARIHVNWQLPRFRGFDLVVLNTLMSFTAQVLMRFVLRGKPWLFWGERLQEREKPSALHSRLTSPLARAAGIVGIGSLAERGYSERFPTPKHFNIPYYCDLQPFIEAPKARNPNSTTFLFCGQMIARKGVDLLLQAFAGLVKRHPKASLLLVGREAELPGLLDALPPEARERIVYEGFQPPERLPLYFARADVFVLPSRYDGWGVVLNQALGAGLPILCSDAVGAGHDLVQQGINGSRFVSGDADSLLREMEHLASNPRLAVSQGEASARRARQWLPEEGAKKWLEVFKEVLGK
jgi:glycosyltransferase involved in cell wall biosynthesis